MGALGIRCFMATVTVIPDRHHFGGGEALSGVWRTDRLAADRVGARHDLAVARQAGRGEHGEPCRGNLLVRPALAADVPADSDDVEERVRVLGEFGCGMRADRSALCVDGVGGAAVWAAAVMPPTLRSLQETGRANFANFVTLAGRRAGGIGKVQRAAANKHG